MALAPEKNGRQRRWRMWRRRKNRSWEQEWRREKLRKTKIESSGVRKRTLGSFGWGSVYTSCLPVAYWVQKESHCQASPNIVWHLNLFNGPTKLLETKDSKVTGTTALHYNNFLLLSVDLKHVDALRWAEPNCSRRQRCTDKLMLTDQYLTWFCSECN